MRNALSLLLAILLLIGLLSGCGKEEEPTEATTLPAVTTAPMEETSSRR